MVIRMQPSSFSVPLLVCTNSSQTRRVCHPAPRGRCLLVLRFRELAAAIADREQPALARQHAPELLEAFSKPDVEGGRSVNVAHGERLICEEIAWIDMAIAV